MKSYAIKLAFAENIFWSSMKQKFTNKWLYADIFANEEQAEAVMISVASFYAPCHLMEIDPQNN